VPRAPVVISDAIAFSFTMFSQMSDLVTNVSENI